MDLALGSLLGMGLGAAMVWVATRQTIGRVRWRLTVFDREIELAKRRQLG